MLAVIGCGNPNRQDDGVGSAVITRLNELAAKKDWRRVKLLDAGLDGVAAMFYASGIESLILIDSQRSGAAPGAVTEIAPNVCAATPERDGGAQQFRWRHALQAGKNIFGENFPRDITVYLVEAEQQGWGLQLTPPVAKAVETLAERIVAQIAGYSAREHVDA